jgi:hypothetical protein
MQTQPRGSKYLVSKQPLSAAHLLARGERYENRENRSRPLLSVFQALCVSSFLAGFRDIRGAQSHDREGVESLTQNAS